MSRLYMQEPCQKGAKKISLLALPGSGNHVLLGGSKGDSRMTRKQKNKAIGQKVAALIVSIDQKIKNGGK